MKLDTSDKLSISSEYLGSEIAPLGGPNSSIELHLAHRHDSNGPQIHSGPL